MGPMMRKLKPKEVQVHSPSRTEAGDKNKTQKYLRKKAHSSVEPESSRSPKMVSPAFVVRCRSEI